MTTQPVCPKCGGQMDGGNLQGLVQFVSDNAKTEFWSLGPEVGVSMARACLSCGFVESYLDPQILNGKTGTV